MPHASTVLGTTLSPEKIDPQPHPAKPEFRPDIEGLRAVAIILVVLYHCGVSAFSGGYVGVDVFFVISGFLITGHLAREVETTGRLHIGRFYARRGMRLLPAATLTIVATLLAAWWWLPSVRLKDIATDGLAATGYVLNYRLAATGTEYRGEGDLPSPLQHFWSLGVEEQFYLVIPLLLVLTAVLLKRRAAFVAVIALVTAGSFAWSVLSTDELANWAYFGAPTRAWELGAGALLALALPYTPRLPDALASLVRLIGLGLIVVAAMNFDDRTPFPGYHAGLPVLGAFLVIAAGRAVSGRLLSHGVMRAIGARSYSWYLWHWPVLLIAPYALDEDFGTGKKLAAAGCAYLMAVISYAMVERPLHELGRERPGWGVNALTGLGLMVVAAVVSLLVPVLPDRTPEGTVNAGRVELTGSTSAREKQLEQKLSASLKVDDLPKNLTPSLKGAARDLPPVYYDGCHQELEIKDVPKSCENFGDPRGKRTVVLFGDSHAAQWWPALNQVAKQKKWRFASFTKSACTAADVRIYLELTKRDYTECIQWRRDILKRVQAMKPAVVVMSANADGGEALNGEGSQDDRWVEGWRRNAEAMQATGAQVVYLEDSAWPKVNVPECLSTKPTEISDCAASERQATTAPDRRKLIEEMIEDIGGTVVDPMPWFCAPKGCPTVVGNMLVYQDDSHVTQVYAKFLGPILGEKLRLRQLK
ncbi:acyltransferase family protein [Kineosporia succinea]|uniref:Peptidoglycan/LPS O-acetylase OafA/YrhL n=1 Tax=Kineosporia succinea TaxID=84632 RepID=A0ABT9P466_9ACTN|nr:acyltransferase family protein [Kineosporia succinea]MDP9827467.1 peptidoglycan/LPS O-acetylase OafA/YrhL [Kineosporia succinea]